MTWLGIVLCIPDFDLPGLNPVGSGGRSRILVRPHTQFRNSHPEDRTMTKYLISFPGSAMDISDEDMAAVGEAAHAVIREAKDAGVYVFGGGINEDVAPLMVAADGTVTNEAYPQTKEFDGGFCVLKLPSRKPPSNGPRRSPKP